MCMALNTVILSFLFFGIKYMGFMAVSPSFPHFCLNIKQWAGFYKKHEERKDILQILRSCPTFVKKFNSFMSKSGLFLQFDIYFHVKGKI